MICRAVEKEGFIMSDIRQNIIDIKQEIAEICERANQNPDDILLLGVTEDSWSPKGSMKRLPKELQI